MKRPDFTKTFQRDSSAEVLKTDPSLANYWPTKKNPESNAKIFRGGLSNEIDIFYVGKKHFQAKKDLFKSKFQIQ